MVGDGLMHWQSASHVVIVSQLHPAFFLVLISGFLFFFAPVFSLAIFCIITTWKLWFTWKKGPNSPAFELRKEKKTHILQQVPEGSQNIKGFLIYWAFISGLEPKLAKYSCWWLPPFVWVIQESPILAGFPSTCWIYQWECESVCVCVCVYHGCIQLLFSQVCNSGLHWSQGCDCQPWFEHWTHWTHCSHSSHIPQGSQEPIHKQFPCQCLFCMCGLLESLDMKK
jgi:hypothetical protein